MAQAQLVAIKPSELRDVPVNNFGWFWAKMS
jgi:hypothetical protein